MEQTNTRKREEEGGEEAELVGEERPVNPGEDKKIRQFCIDVDARKERNRKKDNGTHTLTHSGPRFASLTCTHSCMCMTPTNKERGEREEKEKREGEGKSTPD